MATDALARTNQPGQYRQGPRLRSNPVQPFPGDRDEALIVLPPQTTTQKVVVYGGGAVLATGLLWYFGVFDAAFGSGKRTLPERA